MPGLFSNTGVPLLDILSRAGGVFKPKFEEKFGQEIQQIDAIPDPDVRARKIAAVADQAAAAGYSLPERAPLTARVDEMIDTTLKAGTPESVAQAGRIAQLMGRVDPRGGGMGGLADLSLIMQRGSEAAYNAGPRTTQGLTAAGRNVKQARLAGTRADVLVPAQAGAARAAAGASGAQAGLSEERRADLLATRPERLRALRTAQPDSFHLPIKNPVTGKDEQLLFDAQGNLLQRLGEVGSGSRAQGSLSATTKSMVEAAPKVLELADRVEELVDQQVRQLGPVSSRWSEYMAGTIGAPSAEFTRLRTNVGLLTTLLMRMHVGARGSEKIMEHFKGLIDSSKQSPENLLAAIAEIKGYARDVAALGQPQGAAQGSAPSVTLPPGYTLTPVE